MTMLDVLIVVDVQNDFCEGGSLAVEGGARVAKLINDYVGQVGREYDFIIATQDWHSSENDNGGHFSETPDFVDTWPPHCVADTAGAEIHPALKLPTRTLFFKKGEGVPSYSGFEGFFSDTVTLEEFLHTVTGGTPAHLDIVGIATSHCVKATALDGIRLGHRVAVLYDLCVGVSIQLEAAALKEMEAAGVYLTVA